MERPIATRGDFVTLVARTRAAAQLYQASGLLSLNQGVPRKRGMLLFTPGVLPLVRDVMFEALGIRRSQWRPAHDDAISAASTVTSIQLDTFWSIAAFSDKAGWKGFSSNGPYGMAVAHVILTMMPWLGIDIVREHQLNVLALRAKLQSSDDLLDLSRVKSRLQIHAAGSLARNLAAAVANRDPAAADVFGRFANSAPLTAAEQDFAARITHLTPIPGKGRYIHAQRLPQQRRAYEAALALLLRRFGYEVPAVH